MTEVSFYHLQKSLLEDALPLLLEKTLAMGKRAVVMAGSAARAEQLGNRLWNYRQDAWLPHGTAKDGRAGDQPVWLTTDQENPNDATYLFLTDGAGRDDVGAFERCFELFDGHDGAQVTAARERWKAYKDAGHGLKYMQQNETGGWQEKAAGSG